MAWKILQPEPNQPTQENQVRRDLPLADAIAAKTNSRLNTIIQKTSEAPKAANDNMEALKAANDNAGVWSTSGKVEVASTESRLEQLRAALRAATNAEANADKGEVGEVHVTEPVVAVSASEERAPEPVLETGQTEVKASLPQYTSLSGIDVNNLPKNIPEARGIVSMSAKYEIQNNLKEEMSVWKARRENIEWASQMLSSKGDVDDWTKDYFKTLIGANENNIGKINAKAENLVQKADEEISELGEVVGVDEASIKAFATLTHIRSERFNSTVYRGANGSKFAETFELANDNSALAFINALKKAA